MLCSFFGCFINAQVIDIPDATFKTKLLQSTTASGIAYKNLSSGGSVHIKVDINNSGEIEVNEALLVQTLILDNLPISDLTGISHFTNLVSLLCRNCPLQGLPLNGLVNLKHLNVENANLSGIDLSLVPLLEGLVCSDNNLTSLDLSFVPNVWTLECYNNNLSSLDLSMLSSLSSLNCSNNNLTSLDFSGNPLLSSIYTNGTELTTLDVSMLPQLSSLQCDNNHLTTLDFSSNPLLAQLFCANNMLTDVNLTGVTNLYNYNCHTNLLSSIDISPYPNMGFFDCHGNPPLQFLNIKDGHNNGVDLSGLPNLHYICADEGDEMHNLEIWLEIESIQNCVINSYCSFVPGGIIYTIQGKSRFDSDNNGCSASDPYFPNVKYTISNNVVSGVINTDDTNNFSIPVQSGAHLVTPIIENPGYFNITPPAMQVAFPSTASPYTMNFCISPNGQHNDLEVSIFPVLAARPGFDAVYNIIFKNKGNQIQSLGSVNLSFDENVLDFVSADIAVSSQGSGFCEWVFNNLQPFETRQVEVVFNVNTPLEIPAVNDGDILVYTAVISSPAVDEMPLDNTFTLNQTVVNSFDPNDKTCLEGNTITPEMVGKYVHYMIRFENTGTANAENIVVKDIIDTAKFDISSLIPLDGSHPFITRISDTNKTEFIFENIQLPFDDANNDGYIAFKIKTKPTLVVGNTFSNTASIYFDYNAPIVTNTATTAIQVLGTDDFDFNAQFILFPNPANDIMNIKSKDNLVIHSLSVYNTLGQLVMTAANPQVTIDVSLLSAGEYFMKIVSEKGTASARFFKN